MERQIYYVLWKNNIEVFTIVHRRHGEKYCSTLTLIEVQDIDLSLEFYQQPYNPANENNFNLVQNNYKKQLESYFPINRECLLEFGRKYSQGVKLLFKDFQRPRIFRQKIATTMAMERRLNRAKAQFEKSKSEYLRQDSQGSNASNVLDILTSVQEYKFVDLHTAHRSLGNMVRGSSSGAAHRVSHHRI
ncbi:uncharacterized protein EAF02_009359 [Botrytis sinoallii]|uniref:uncharacterized protein n=1 Tax=Botrytis sinoallii TaxID=1463999 RepID=UPI001901787C|nr:uncharacterized protein EAF02_009359 [Botrytis sinoallii]KAF7870169.1 hypothetical protein EAF02_009359 [Botrytis sinoallii]